VILTRERSVPLTGTVARTRPARVPSAVMPGRQFGRCPQQVEGARILDFRRDSRSECRSDLHH
jgi:hypothetical protein